MQFKFWATLVLALLLTVCAIAQNDDIHDSRKTEARSLLRQLPKGVLVVRLNSNHRKMTELERLLDSPDVNEKSKIRFKKMLETTRMETRQEGLDLMKAFDGNYNFSKVLFMFDTASLLLKNGVKSGYFLNEALEVDSSLRLESNDWLLMYFRHESPVSFILLDQNLETVERPFPLPKRPVLRKYVQGQFYEVYDSEGPWKFGEKDNATGFVLFMTYNKKNQLKFFSVLISNWQKDLTRASKRMRND